MNSFITGTGLYTPKYPISNQELVDSFNQYVDLYNTQNNINIKKGKLQSLQYSNCDFIEKASGIKQRYVYEKKGLLNPQFMHPLIAERSNDQPSILCEIALKATQDALIQANKSAKNIDLIIVACSNLPRAYPGLAIEIQHYLASPGYAFDMNVACSSATFGIAAATQAINAQQAKCVLVVNPEICTAHINFKDRDSHFIFGDACTATIIENNATVNALEIHDIALKTQYSNNIRNNFGFLNRTAPTTRHTKDKLFIQKGKKVFKEIIPFISNFIASHLNKNNKQPHDIKKFFMHQANANINWLIMKKLFNSNAKKHLCPLILDKFGNTSSAGVMIALHLHQKQLNSGDWCNLCSFGAGYSVGSLLLKKI